MQPALLQENNGLITSVGQAIAACRQSSGMTQREFGIEIGASTLFVQKIEKGELDFDLIMLERCATAFGITVGELIELAETLKNGGELLCLEFGADETPIGR